MGLTSFSSMKIALWISLSLAAILLLRENASPSPYASDKSTKRFFNNLLNSRREETFSNLNLSNGDCETDPMALVDSSGNECIDFEDAALQQHIIAVKSEKVTYAYCFIPKNGCTYHVGLMHRVMGYAYTGGGRIHGREHKARLRLSGDELKEIMLDPDTPKYVVVRNPLERTLSAYLNKVEHYLPDKDKTPENFEKWAFSTLYPGMEDGKVNPHWKPQVSYCGFRLRGLWKKFRWFTVEEPAGYVDFLEENLPNSVLKDGWNGSSNASFREAVLGPRERTENTSERFFKYVRTLALFDHLVSCYRVDIEQLGYEDAVNKMRQQLLGIVKEREPKDDESKALE